MFAHSIHKDSLRKNGPFVTINCASLPESLLEAELFGYSEGAFTGASKGGRAGLFEQAHGGTIFLDEVGEISSRLQILFLRVLQEKEVRRIGGSQTIYVDVRIIAASNRKLIELVKKGAFREDLFYRLNVLKLTIPPLRERREDIPLLINHFLNKDSLALSQNISIKPDAFIILQDYYWPGNVRQLENILQRLIVTAEKESSIDPNDVKRTLEGEPCYPNHMDLLNSNNTKTVNALDDSELEKHITLNDFEEEVNSITEDNNEFGLLSKIETETILRVLKSVKGNRQETARILGISSTTLWRRLKRLGIDPDTKSH